MIKIGKTCSRKFMLSRVQTSASISIDYQLLHSYHSLSHIFCVIVWYLFRPRFPVAVHFSIYIFYVTTKQFCSSYFVCRNEEVSRIKAQIHTRKLNLIHSDSHKGLSQLKENMTASLQCVYIHLFSYDWETPLWVPKCIDVCIYAFHPETSSF